MNFIDTISDGVRRGSESLSRTTENTNLKMRADKLLRQRQTLTSQLGASLYDLTHDDPAFRVGREEIYDAIEAIDSERAAIQDRIDELSAEAERARRAAYVYRCPRCGSNVGATDAFCMGCGMPVADILAFNQTRAEASKPWSAPSTSIDSNRASIVSRSVCPSCNSPIEAGDAFCVNCGKPLSNPAENVSKGTVGVSDPVEFNQSHSEVVEDYGRMSADSSALQVHAQAEPLKLASDRVADTVDVDAASEAGS